MVDRINGRFVKGCKQQNTGRTHFKKGNVPWNKGKKCPQISGGLKGRTIWWKDKLSKAKQGKYDGENNPFYGKKHTEETRKKMRLNSGRRGKKPWNYIDGRSKFLSTARYGDDWEAIRYLIYLRDKFTCQDCGVGGISLDIHHKVPFLISFDNSLDNLITLCRSCHMKREKNLLKKQEVKII